MCNMNNQQKSEALIYSQKTLEIEGLKQNDELIKFTHQYLNNKMTKEEAIQNIRNQYLNRKKPVNV